MLIFLLASNNAHKVKELSKSCLVTFFYYVSPEQARCRRAWKSFYENGGSGECLLRSVQSPVIADDSGLTVKALPQDWDIFGPLWWPGLSDRRGL